MLILLLGIDFCWQSYVWGMQCTALSLKQSTNEDTGKVHFKLVTDGEQTHFCLTDTY